MEKRLLRALAHSVRRNHELDPAGCHGCREVAAFLAVPGYGGDAAMPPCNRRLRQRRAGEAGPDER